MRIGDRTESDHLSLKMRIQGPIVGGEEEDQKKKGRSDVIDHKGG